MKENKMDILRVKDEFQYSISEGKHFFIHINHRWTLASILLSQNENLVSTPCNLIVFDQHRDDVDICKIVLNKIKAIRNKEVPLEFIIDLCDNDLRVKSDDWIIAGFELGLIGDAIVFGCHDPICCDSDSTKYIDHVGNCHKFYRLGLPQAELGSRQSLSDIHEKNLYIDLWDIINWEPMRGGGFHFRESKEKMLLSIDLDCFADSFRHYYYIFPWPKEIYNGEFNNQPNNGYTFNWTGKLFFNSLLKQCEVVDIAREPTYCGGISNSKKILSDLNAFLFDGILPFQSS